MVRGRSVVFGVVLVTLIVAGCGRPSPEPTSATGSTRPPAHPSSVHATSTTAVTESPTTAPAIFPDAPSELPRYIVLAHGQSSPFATLTTLDRRSGATIELVGISKPPPGLESSSWTMTGFDVSPDGSTVAFGVLPWSSSTSDTLPTASTATVYFEPIDGSSPARRAWTITGIGPSVAGFSPDGQWLLGSTQAAWAVWPVGGGEPIVSDLPAPYGGASQWSPDGTHIAIAQHYERSCCGATVLLRFDAGARTLRLVPASPESEAIPGTGPWYSSDGVLHVVTDPSLVCGSPRDIDATLRWALSAAADGCSGTERDLMWWPTATGPQDARPLGLTLPSGSVFGAAW